jgi:hypothetical protein
MRRRENTCEAATKVMIGKKVEEVRSDFSAPRWPIT